MEYVKAQQKIAVLWYIGTVIIFFIICIQTFTNHYGSQSGDTWDWFLKQIVPNVTLITGAFVTNALGKAVERTPITKFLFRIVFFSSLIYLLLVFSIFLVEPVVSDTILGLTQKFTIPFTILQSMVTLVLGVFFVKK